MRTIPSALLDKKKSDSSTLCYIIKISPINGGNIVGLTTLNKDVIYNDGSGLLTYSAPVGFQPANIMETADVSVDNTEFKSLFPEYDVGISEEDMIAGVYDYADFIFYEVDYQDLSAGHWVVMSGKLGQMKSSDGITSFGELRSLMSGLRKSIVEKDSRTCRAKFGSQSGDLGVVSYCGYNADALWINGTVSSLSLEITRVFSCNTLTQEDGFFKPGLIQFLTGNNAGRYYEIEEFSATVLTLAFESFKPIQIGDTFRIRQDCSKQARDEKHGCKYFHGSNWPLSFRGEPDIPIGEASAQTPNTGT